MRAAQLYLIGGRLCETNFVRFDGTDWHELPALPDSVVSGACAVSGSRVRSLRALTCAAATQLGMHNEAFDRRPAADSAIRPAAGSAIAACAADFVMLQARINCLSSSASCPCSFAALAPTSSELR